MVLGQETLTLQQAVSLALEKNYAVRIAQKNQQIADNDNRLAMANFLPTASATFNQNNNYNLKFVQALRGNPGQPLPEPRDFSNTRNSNLTYGATVNWTVFNGLGMFIAFERVAEVQALGADNTPGRHSKYSGGGKQCLLQHRAAKGKDRGFRVRLPFPGSVWSWPKPSTKSDQGRN